MQIAAGVLKLLLPLLIQNLRLFQFWKSYPRCPVMLATDLASTFISTSVHKEVTTSNLHLPAQDSNIFSLSVSRVCKVSCSLSYF